MRSFTWKEYYESFYDWSASTQKAYVRRLTSFGPADEVFEVAESFAFDDEKFTSKFIQMALDAGVRFKPEHILESTILVDKPTLSRMAESSSEAFTKDQLEEIYMLVDDPTFQKLSKKYHIDIFADEDEIAEDELPEEEHHNWIEAPAPKIGFFTALMAGIGLSGVGKKQHSGRCNGDCAHCPPHYGYRYGRWYYGHGHQYGCEFGGNKGDGSL